MSPLPAGAPGGGRRRRGCGCRTRQFGRAEHNITTPVRTFGIARLNKRRCGYCRRAATRVLDRCHESAVPRVAILGTARVDELPGHRWTGRLSNVISQGKADDNGSKCGELHIDWPRQLASMACQKSSSFIGVGQLMYLPPGGVY